MLLRFDPRLFRFRRSPALNETKDERNSEGNALAGDYIGGRGYWGRVRRNGPGGT